MCKQKVPGLLGKSSAIKSSVSLSLAIFIRSEIAMMRLIVAAPVLPVGRKEHRICIHVAGRNHHGFRQPAVDIDAHVPGLLV